MAVGCGEKCEKEKINRLDVFFYDYPAMADDEKSAMLDSLRPGIEALFFITGDSLCENGYDRYAQSRAVRMFTPDIIGRLTNLDSVEHVLWKVNDNMRRILPDVMPREIYGIVSPYNQSVFVVDSLMLVGLNHYLGADYPGYSNFDSYRRRTKLVKYMPYDMVEAMVSSAYPYVPTENATVLERMLYHGAVVTAVMNAVPEASLADALGYTREQYEWVVENSNEIWNMMILRRLIYSTSESDADKLLQPSPASVIINKDAPGRVGRYMGYRIVSAYMKRHPDIGLPQLLSPEFYGAEDALIESEYDGR